MRLFILLCCYAGLSAATATTLDLVSVWQPLSLYGTDSDSVPEGFDEPVQARVMARPLVLQGAMPESLVSAVAAPTKLQYLPPGAKDGDQEVNLLVLCGIKLQPELEQNGLKITVDVSAILVPDEIRLSQKQILQLGIQSLEKTLKDHYKPLSSQGEGDESMKVSIRVVGTSEQNADLVKLGKKFEVRE